MKLKLSISPCPNDTFAFYGLLHGCVDCENLEFDVSFADISQLNNCALAGEADVIKVSSAVLGRVTDSYDLLPSGGAMGYGNGPLLVSKTKIYKDELHDAVVGIPGEHTTANLLLDRTLGRVKEKREYLFSDIAEAVESGEIDAGILIHEGRFTYGRMGLMLVADLGLEWEELTGLPIPLGVIISRNSLGTDIYDRLGRVIRRSVDFAMANPDKTRDFVSSHARELDEDVLQKHISYFVNDFTVNMGEAGLNAIRKLTGIDAIQLRDKSMLG